MTKTSIPFSAFHPKPRLKYRFNIFSVLGHITEWAKVTEGKKCLGWRPTNNAEFADSGMNELAAMEPLPRAFYFFHAVASAEHDHWTPSQAHEAWEFFNTYESTHTAQAEKVADLEHAYIRARNALRASTEQALAKTIETRTVDHKAAEEKAKTSAEVTGKCEERAQAAKATWHTEVAVLIALETRMKGIRPIAQRALNALHKTDAAYAMAA